MALSSRHAHTSTVAQGQPSGQHGLLGNQVLFSKLLEWWSPERASATTTMASRSSALCGCSRPSRKRRLKEEMLFVKGLCLPLTSGLRVLHLVPGGPLTLMCSCCTAPCLLRGKLCGCFFLSYSLLGEFSVNFCGPRLVGTGWGGEGVLRAPVVTNGSA